MEKTPAGTPASNPGSDSQPPKNDSPGRFSKLPKFSRRNILVYLGAFVIIGGIIAVIASFAASPGKSKHSHAFQRAAKGQVTICNLADKKVHASAGLRSYCNGVNSRGLSKVRALKSVPSGQVNKSVKNKNVAASDLDEDVSASGTRGYGQVETAIGGSGKYVVEAWNDATAFFSDMCSFMNKDQLTGFSFSSDGGASFTDLGGLPNSECSHASFFGDPSVTSYTKNGNTYFYISSLMGDFNNYSLKVAMDVCQVAPTPAPARLNCNGPYILADAGDGGALDKSFMAVDSQRGKLYVSYTDFTYGADNIDLAMCDLANPAAPNCTANTSTSYIALASQQSCGDLQGSYPAVDPGTGDVYVAYEYNGFGPDPFIGCHEQTKQIVLRVPYSHCLATFPDNSGCPHTNHFDNNSVNVTSMVYSLIPGYNRGLANDFPRIAISPQYKTVSIVWNDARSKPLGDIMLQSFKLADLSKVQAAPTPLDSDGIKSNLHFLPAISVDKLGKLYVSWYDRRKSPTTAQTDVYAATAVLPTATKAGGNVPVTNTSTNWLNVASAIVPNFGDYTDSYYDKNTGLLHVAWTDGRLNVPQAYTAAVK